MEQTLRFLAELRENNNREWFTAHREQYEAARDSFADLVQELIFRANSLMPLGNLSARECIMRIYNDMRFHKDRPPYKTNFGASIRPGGKNSQYSGYYLHLEPENSFLAGGLYAPSGKQLRPVRERIAEDDQPLRNLLAAPEFRSAFGELSGERLKTSPRGYSSEHPAIDLLNFKQFVVFHPVSHTRVTSAGFADDALGVFAAMTPLLRWLNETAAA